MIIVSRNELCQYPVGTVYMKYEPDITDGNIHIKTDSEWNSELTFIPFWEENGLKKSERYCKWITTDTTMCDYDEKQQFIVYSKTEVQQMINALIWAIGGCESYFNQDDWFCGDLVIPE